MKAKSLINSESNTVNSYGHLSDTEWFEMIVRSIDDASLGLPGFPSKQTQETFVGKSGMGALQEAFDFYQLIKNRAVAMERESRVLDFGVGWGRIIRFFCKDIPDCDLYGVDVDAAILAEAKATGIRADLRLIQPTGQLPFSCDYFDIIYSFSVFSHLSPAAAKHWLTELMRALKPNGMLILTTTTDRFLELCRASRDKTQGRNVYEEQFVRIFADPLAALEAYRRGEYVYAATGGAAAVLDAQTYGWASMPPQFVRDEIGKLAEDIEFFDPPQFEQGVFIIQKLKAGL